MYTEQQAREALAQKCLRDLEKRLMVMYHGMAIADQPRYGLPYRTLFNYYKSDPPHNEVPLNPFYPFPGIPLQYKPPAWNPERDGGYTNQEWLDLITKPTGEYDDNGKEKVVLEIPEDIQAKINAWQAEKVKEQAGGEYHHIWDLETEKGRQAWLYWFGVFLLPYKDDIPGWGVFDMYGDSSSHTEQELTERKRYYMGLIKQCETNPDCYKHEVQKKQLSDYGKYDLGPLCDGYMWHDKTGTKPTPPPGKDALQIMYHERERLQTYYGSLYAAETRDRYSMAYRVETIIKELEKGK